MTLNLANVVMITGLNISHLVTPFRLLDPVTHEISTRYIGGWAKYTTAYSRSGSIDDREHNAFLNMCLEKIILCGSILDPTSNH